MKDLLDISDDELNELVEDKIMDFVDKTENDNPFAYLIVGQPGAGKTTIANILQKQYDNDIVFINGDEYRKKHPHYAELYQQYGDDAVLKTGVFAGKMTESLIDKLSDKRFNLIIEGTLRTTEIPLKTKGLLEKKGYTVELAVMLVKPEISYLSTIQRYHRMKEIGTIPRATPKKHHDLVVKNILTNLNELYKTKSFSNISMYDRAGKKIYNMRDKPAVNPAGIMKREFERAFSLKEKQDIRKTYEKYIGIKEIKEILRGKEI